ncbi:MAG TPA: MerR family transcriptional regulator [Candidatus Dormibacteraeota bacterium]|nr:MerR family transcriptional regulator [Candidatus Dormibacteraeota bacterium]
MTPAAATPTDRSSGCRGLLGIGEAAARAEVSERALRYYQQLGLITPSGQTPGGMRRYSEGDVARVRRLRELQSLLGFNLDEIRSVFDNEDRLAALREEYRSARTGAGRRRELITEGLVLQEQLRATVQTKLGALTGFLDDLDGSIAKMRDVLAGRGAPG